MPDAPAVAGVSFAAGEAGIRYRGRTDVMLALFDEGTTVAGVLTRSKCPSAPVDWCRARLPGGRARALVVNSGNANAFTGQVGAAATQRTAELAVAAFGVAPEEVFLASTGVIGEPLDASRFEGVLQRLGAAAAAGGIAEAARAIMTTDTFPKVATAAATIDGVAVTLNGIAKGAGMIAPDMATMLSFLFTDAPIAAPVLQALLSEAVEGSFNAITVDSDTSTSDTLLLFATGAAAARGAPLIAEPGDPRLAGFREALRTVTLDLAHQVVCDGEGARKFVEVTVTGRRQRRRGQDDRQVDRQFAPGENRGGGRGRQLGPGRDGGRQGRRARRPRPPGDLVRADPGRGGRPARSGLRRGGGVGVHAGRPHRDPGRHRPGDGPRHDVDLRPHQGLRRDQRRLPLLIEAGVPAPAVGAGQEPAATLR